MNSGLDVAGDRRLNYLAADDRIFVVKFHMAAQSAGYECNELTEHTNQCIYMLQYTKAGVSSSRPVACLMMQDDCIQLKLIFKDIDKHMRYIERAPEHIRQGFAAGQGDCIGCRGAGCRYTKEYTMEGQQIKKCSRNSIMYSPDLDYLTEYVSLLNEFYGHRRNRKKPATAAE